MADERTGESLSAALDPRQRHAARYVIARVRSEVHAELVQGSLFGSRARGDARPDSDVDLLLVFRSLPADREPFATYAERIADEEAHRLRVPVSVWSVSLVDLALGNRTPMLVDAMADAIPIWTAGPPLPRVSFTPQDAVRCAGALLERTSEGSAAFTAFMRRGDSDSAARRLRDDLIRLCTASLLLRGITSPRHGEVARAHGEQIPRSPAAPLLPWAERSYGESGKDEEAPVPTPPAGFRLAARQLERLRQAVENDALRLRSELGHPGASGRPRFLRRGMDLALIGADISPTQSLRSRNRP